MRRRREQVEPDEPAGAPEWMVTFSDCMTLLLTFFVLLLSFSSFDEKIYRKLKVIFCNAMSSASQPIKSDNDKDAFLPTEQIELTKELVEGSEKPTLEKGAADNLKVETESVDFHSQKVFSWPSNEIFWGKGTAISSEGHKTLATMASFLKEVPGRIVISENGPGDKENKKFGLPRTWAVMEYLTTNQGLNKRRFSISATSTIRSSNHKSRGTSHGLRLGKRVLEIVLLERSIYN